MSRRPRTLVGAGGGLLGALALLALGVATRAALRAPTLPEVLAEGGTFFVPGELFTFMVNRFGASAKLMLFWGMVALVVLTCVAAGALYARRPTPRLAVALALGLWLFELVVVLPVAGLGLFGSEVYPAGPLATMAASLIGWAGYAVVLAIVYWLAIGRAAAGPRPASASTAQEPAKEVSR